MHAAGQGQHPQVGAGLWRSRLLQRTRCCAGERRKEAHEGKKGQEAELTSACDASTAAIPCTHTRTPQHPHPTDGPLEYIFVLENKLDPAHAAITQLLLNHPAVAAGGGEGVPGGGGGSGGSTHSSKGAAGGGYERTHRIVFSGAASGTSQKIHK